jgi:hypothetical protein
MPLHSRQGASNSVVVSLILLVIFGAITAWYIFNRPDDRKYPTAVLATFSLTPTIKSSNPGK